MDDSVPGHTRDGPSISRRQFLGVAAVAGVGGGAIGIHYCSSAASPGHEVTPEQFGAVGDGVSNDQPAFDRLNEWLLANDGGIISLGAGKTYLAGRQVPGEQGYYLAPKPIIGVEGVSRLIIQGNGATIRFKSGLKFGAFDPGTGRSLSEATTDRSKAAAIGWAVRAHRVRQFEVHRLSVDGNSQGMMIGGPFGDDGRQLYHAGLEASECEAVVWRNVHVVNSCLDGFLYHYTLLREQGHSGALSMLECSSDRVARNGMSYTGGAGGIVQNCVFKRAGEAPNAGMAGGHFGSKPKSCFDLEAEQSLIRRFTSRGNRFLSGANSNTCIDVNSGDIAQALFDDCFFAGRAWFNRPGVVVRGSTFQGSLAKFLGGSATPTNNTLFEDCRMSDRPYGDNLACKQGLFDGAGSGGTPESMARFRRCRFVITGLAVDARFTDIESSEFIIEMQANCLPFGEQVINITASRWRDVRILDRVTALRPGPPFLINGINMRHSNVRLVPSARRMVRFGPDVPA